ncbi:MAG: MFS transporter [Woeseiaceae bacterium]
MTSSAIQRFIQLGVLTLAAGAMYPLIYLRQNFEVSILESFEITIAQLGQCYSMLGVIFVVTYLPSGWLADRVSPRILVVFSLVCMALLGIWFSTMPSFESLLIIFAGWGIVTGLTFWAAMIKAVAVLAEHNEQGRFFGILEGGRGLVEAILASIAAFILYYSVNELLQSTSTALLKIIYLYVGFALVLAPIVYLTIDDRRAVPDHENQSKRSASQLFADLAVILGNKAIWLASFCILSGYQLFWATYSFSGYLQNIFGLTAVAGAVLTVIKLWMRPIGAIAAGFIGDRFNLEKTLSGLMLAGTISVGSLILLPVSAAIPVLLGAVITIGLTTYAIRGIFWATLDGCEIPIRIKGLAIGVMSLIGYSPDIYLGLLNGYLLETYPGKTGYDLYFGFIVFMGLLGTIAAWRLHMIVSRQNK